MAIAGWIWVGRYYSESAQSSYFDPQSVFLILDVRKCKLVDIKCLEHENYRSELCFVGF